MRNWRRRTLVAAAVSVTALLGLVASASAGNTQISGIGYPDDGTACTDMAADYYILMTGDLTGCVYGFVDAFAVTPSGVYLEWGTETFVGCLDGTCGSFDTTYKFTAKFAPSGEEIHGRCQHPIAASSGTDDFAGVTGRIDFKDDVEAGNFPYRGHLKL